MLSLRYVGLRESRVSKEAHELYRTLIDTLVRTGARPDTEQSDVLRELAEQDWIALDDTGQVIVLYPFSLEPSEIEVRLKGQNLYAMCAIDALGMAPMLDSPVEIQSACPQTGDVIQISVTAQGFPTSITGDVAVLRRRQAGAAHLNRCAATRFFRSNADACDWRDAHGHPDDVVLSLRDAFIEAAGIFGRCYSDGIRLVL
jgi:hypothetical protein